jgi:hypothetical protein
MTTATYTAEARCLSDFHKDAYGFRPSQATYAAWAAMSDAELDAVEERLGRALDSAMAEEAAAHDRATAAFEARIADLIALGAKDRATAIRWDMDATGITADDAAFYGMDWYGYHHGLPMGYFNRAAQ